MLMMMKVTIPVAAGNEALKSGKLQSTMEDVLGRIKPQSAYFTVEGGNRTALFFFDLSEQSQMPSVAEPLFMGLDAQIDMTPCMTGEDLQKGLAAWVG